MRNSRNRRHPVRRTAARRQRISYGHLSTAAVNQVGKELQQLQRALESGEIDSAEFESRMEELESRSRAGRRAVVLHRARMALVQQVGQQAANRVAASHQAAIEPADVMLLQNAMKQLGEARDADTAIRMLRDIVDAASEMARELGA